MVFLFSFADKAKEQDINLRFQRYSCRESHTTVARATVYRNPTERCEFLETNANANYYRSDYICEGFYAHYFICLNNPSYLRSRYYYLCLGSRGSGHLCNQRPSNTWLGSGSMSSTAKCTLRPQCYFPSHRTSPLGGRDCKVNTTSASA